ncbi:MAG: phosphoglycerate kinase [Candidatus Azotimanducaceae bacterium]|uniref:Phosphoglycerate kinase n=1 Tax=OM182 bacterium TaxID=2510334 RepID=A0A520S5D3_9GAMM|nr:phosphoglycerate kinase [Gammaproteobacteria bacterium]OUV68668.1 MAG: phosphoglycerate kinase [Gammaproteobacteria bacterium TMED133]RZO77670.1 MAG: phosphoglycerate kinase [OM182 bacterium]
MLDVDFLELDLKNKRVLIREDLNVPMKKGKILSNARLLAALPTIKHAVDNGAEVTVMSHLGRPRENLSIRDQPEFSLKPVVDRLEVLSGLSFELVSNYIDGFVRGKADVTVLENVRLNLGESTNNQLLSKRLAALCDIYVMDAFACAHRAHSSTTGIIRYAPISCSGPLLRKELDALRKALYAPKKPMLAIVGGSKVSTKLAVLESLVNQLDQLIVGGGIANTFLAAKGFDIGRSLYENDLLEFAADLYKKINIPLPTDVVVASGIKSDAQIRICNVSDIRVEEMIVDFGPESISRLKDFIACAGTILWNGPIGVFEIDKFEEGTKQIAEAIASSRAFSLAGGGDTLAAIERYGVNSGISYSSTGGGAFLEYVGGQTLPAVQELANQHNSKEYLR